MTIRDFISHIKYIYFAIGQKLIDENIVEFDKGVNPNLPISVYTHKQEICQFFAQ